MKTLGYYNGHYDELENMTVPMSDRACSFGDGLYDSAYARNGVVYSLPDHVDRIFRGAAELDIAPPCTKSEMIALINDLVKKVDANEVFVYWQITRGTQPRMHAYTEGLKSNLWIIIREMSIRETYQKIKLISREDTRFFHCHIKTLNLLPGVLAATEAKRQGCDECVFHRGERVTECAHSNIQILKDGKLIEPPADNMILPGIQRARIMRLCESLGIPVEERPFTMAELMDADEVIVSSAGSLCLSVSEIDGIPVGGKAPALLKRLQDILHNDFLTATKKK